MIYLYIFLFYVSGAVITGALAFAGFYFLGTKYDAREDAQTIIAVTFMWPFAWLVVAFMICIFPFFTAYHYMSKGLEKLLS